MTLVDEAILFSMDIWEKCRNHPFLKELSNGTLLESKLKTYIIQDSIYLREYAKCFSYGIINSKTLNDVKLFYSLMSYVNEKEGSTRLKYLKKFDLTDEYIDNVVPYEECKKYYEFMIEKSKIDHISCLMAILPCMLSYEYIFKKISSEEKINEKYKDLIDDYLSTPYFECCKKWSKYTNDLFLKIDKNRKEELLAIFRQSSIYELEFWDMSYNK